MTGVETSEAMKASVRAFWNAHPCGTQFTHLPWESIEFFEEVERLRYQIQPFMRDLARFDGFRGKQLLEVGCGVGTDSLQFARGGAHVTSVDLTPASVELTKRNFARAGLAVEARVADAENLPFGDNTFDVVYSFGVLHHTPNTAKAIHEVYRVLKPGGKAIIMLYHKHSIHVLLGLPLFWIFSRMNGKNASALQDWIRVYDGDENPLGKAYSRSEARQMMSDFKDLQITIFDPIRRRFPNVLNSINQRLFAPWLGFWMVLKAEKL